LTGSTSPRNDRRSAAPQVATEEAPTLKFNVTVIVETNFKWMFVT